MDKATFRKYILIATYIILLYLGVSHIDAVASGVGYVFGVIKPLVIGACIMFVMNVLLKFYEKHLIKVKILKLKNGAKLTRILCILLTYATFALLITILALVVIPQVTQSIRTLAVQMPSYLSMANTWIEDWGQQMGLTSGIWDFILNIWKQFEISLSDLIKNAATVAIDVTVNVTMWVFNFFVGLVFAAYMLYSKEKLVKICKKVCYAVFKAPISDKIVEIAKEANVTFSRFIGGQLVEAVILGGLCFIGMLIIGIPYAPLISCLVGATSLIPILGAYIGTIPSAFIILMEDPIKAIVFVIFIIVLQQVEGNVIYPKVVGNAIGLDGLWVFVAIIVGGGLWGIMGMLIGVPLMAVIYSLVRQYTEKFVKKRGVSRDKYETE